MTSAESMNGGGAGGGGGGGRDIERGVDAVELVGSAPLEVVNPDSVSISDDPVTPLLSQTEKPKINLFSVSYSRRKPVKQEQVSRLSETETSPLTQFVSWVWSGSRYSGLLCMAFSAIIYSGMEFISDTFSAEQIPLFEIAFIRCTIISVFSFLWLRRSGQMTLGLTNVRSLLVLRAVTGLISLLSFIYCIQRLSLSQAIILSFTTPIMASTAARIILHEKMRIAEVAGLACSFVGMIFTFQPLLDSQEVVSESGDADNPSMPGSRHLYAILIGLLSSIVGGISYCLIRAGAKAIDQPVTTVLSFGLLASPAAAMCAFTVQDFVVPGFYTLLLMFVLGALAFIAEVTLARGLQLEKTARVVNIQYIEVVISQLLGMGLSRIAPSFSNITGCLLILLSSCSTIYTGPEKETE